jgi:hypothetical protein
MAPAPAVNNEDPNVTTVTVVNKMPRRRVAIRLILLEIARKKIPKMDFLTLIVDYIFSGEFTYTYHFQNIGNFFVAEDMLQETEAEDYARLFSLKRLYDQENDECLNERISNLISVNGEAFACLFEEFRKVIQEDPALQGFSLEAVKQISGEETSVLKIPDYEPIPSTEMWKLTKSPEHRKTKDERRKRKRKSAQNVSEVIVNTRRKLDAQSAGDKGKGKGKGKGKDKSTNVINNSASSSSAINSSDHEYDPVQADRLWNALSEEDKSKYYDEYYQARTHDAINNKIRKYKKQGKTDHATLLEKIRKMQHG